MNLLQQSLIQIYCENWNQGYARLVHSCHFTAAWLSLRFPLIFVADNTDRVIPRQLPLHGIRPRNVIRQHKYGHDPSNFWLSVKRNVCARWYVAYVRASVSRCLTKILITAAASRKFRRLFPTMSPWVVLGTTLSRWLIVVYLLGHVKH